jgi:putative FmdB family regulatory protein
MPLYEYECAGCGARIEKMRKLSERANGPACPECGEATALALSAPGRVSVGSGGSGSAIPTSVNMGGCGPGGCGVGFN